jgi:hypothetical protein
VDLGFSADVGQLLAVILSGADQVKTAVSARLLPISDVAIIVTAVIRCSQRLTLLTLSTAPLLLVGAAPGASPPWPLAQRAEPRTLTAVDRTAGSETHPRRQAAKPITLFRPGGPVPQASSHQRYATLTGPVTGSSPGSSWCW